MQLVHCSPAQKGRPAHPIRAKQLDSSDDLMGVLPMADNFHRFKKQKKK